MKTVFIFAVALLAGCTSAISQEEIALATKVCEPHGGLEYISTIHMYVKCKSGVIVNYSGLR